MGSDYVFDFPANEPPIKGWVHLYQIVYTPLGMCVYWGEIHGVREREKNKVLLCWEFDITIQWFELLFYVYSYVVDGRAERINTSLTMKPIQNVILLLQ